MSTTQPHLTAAETDPRTLRRVVGAGFLGTTVEYYDFFIYGTAAALVFPRVFFPELGAAAGTAASFATFAVAFVARPFGGALFGHVGDRLGRKTTLVATMLIMGVATVLIGLLPTGDAIGVAAPILLITLRFLQGLAVGGEWGSAALFVGEYAPPGKRGVYALAPALGTSCGLLVATLVFLATDALVADEAFLDWGWRVPFLLSVVLVAIGLWVRLGVADTPVFRAAQAHAREASRTKLPIGELLRHQWRRMLLAAGGILLWQPFFTIAAVFMINYGTATVGLSRGAMLTANVVAVVFCIAGMVLGGRLADRIGRRRTLLGANGSGLVLAFVLFPLVDTGEIALAALGMSVTLFAVGIASSAMTAYMPELFPTAYRATGVGVAFNLGSAVGASVPAIVAAPVFAATGRLGVALMLAAFALVATGAVVALHEVGDRPLDATDEVPGPAAGGA